MALQKVICAMLFVPALAIGQAKDAPTADSPWLLLKPFAGRWRGVTQGEPGKGTVERQYQFIFKAKFLRETNTSTYPPQKKNAKGEVHHHFSVFSYDRQRKKIVFRQFHQEGFINQYVLESASPDGKRLVFVTEAIENIPPGWRARETYTVASDNEIAERFELAAPGKEFELYSENRLTRVK